MNNPLRMVPRTAVNIPLGFPQRIAAIFHLRAIDAHNQEFTADPRALRLRDLHHKIWCVRAGCLFSQAINVAGAALSIYGGVRYFTSDRKSHNDARGVLFVASAVFNVVGLFHSRISWGKMEKDLATKMLVECGTVHLRTTCDRLIFA